MTECMNNALYKGLALHDTEWYGSILNFSVSLVNNKLFKVYYRQEKSDYKIQAYEAIYNKINKSNYDVMRRVSWKLAKNYFKQSVKLFDAQ